VCDLRWRRAQARMTPHNCWPRAPLSSRLQPLTRHPHAAPELLLAGGRPQVLGVQPPQAVVMALGRRGRLHAGGGCAGRPRVWNAASFACTWRSHPLVLPAGAAAREHAGCVAAARVRGQARRRPHLLLEGQDAPRVVHAHGVRQHLLVLVLGGRPRLAAAAVAAGVLLGEVQVGHVQVDGGAGGDEAVHLGVRGGLGCGVRAGRQEARDLARLCG